jgi:hypothetical protein
LAAAERVERDVAERASQDTPGAFERAAAQAARDAAHPSREICNISEYRAMAENSQRVESIDRSNK